MRFACPFAVFALLLAATPALSGDGVVEINQTCADAPGGCFCGDSQFVPVTITGCAGRSYRLTSDLRIGSPVHTGLLVAAPDVSIDLGGFAIRGFNVCDGTPGGCAYAGTGSGIEAIPGGEGNPDRLRVVNGSIVGIGGIGIFDAQGRGLLVRDVRIAHSGGFGILFHGDSATIDDVSATRNGNSGLVAGGSAIVRRSHFEGNGGTGAQVGNGSRVESSTFRSNAGHGLYAGSGTAIHGCEAAQNAFFGIGFHAGTLSGQELGGTVRDSVASRNGTDGIQTRTGVLVSHNSVVQNANAGLSLYESAYGDNVIVGNPGGAVVGSFNVDLGGNACVNQGAPPGPCP